MSIFHKNDDTIYVEVGCSWQRCPKCGVEGGHIGHVKMTEGEFRTRRGLDRLTSTDATDYTCLQCREYWEKGDAILSRSNHK